MSEELKNKLELVAKGITEIHKRTDELKKEGSTNHGETKEAIAKITADVEIASKALEDHTIKIEAQANALEAQEKANETLTKAILDKGESNSAGSDPEYDEAFQKWMKFGERVPEELLQKTVEGFYKKHTYGAVDEQVKEIARLARKDLAAGSAPDGGFFLSNDRATRMSERIFETSPVRTLANLETTTSDVWEIVLDDGEPGSGWVGETQARPVTDSAQVGLIKIPIHELYAMPRATQKILDDAGFDIASWHQKKVGRKFGRDENLAFVLGSGAGTPKGFMTYAAWAVAGTYERDAVEQVTSAASGVIDGDDLIALQGSLEEDYQSSAVWAMRRQTFFNHVINLQSTAGGYLFDPRMLAIGAPMMLLGKPVRFFADMAAVTNSSLSIAYADWKEFYTIVDRMGVRVLRDPYSSKPYTLFYTTKRVGGAVTNYEAGKILKTKA